MSLVVAFLAAGLVAVTTFMVVSRSKRLNKGSERTGNRESQSERRANAKAEAFRLQIAEAEVWTAEAKVALERFKAPARSHQNNYSG